MGKKTARHGRNVEANTVIGIAWYKPEQWQRLLDISADRDNLEDSWAEWARNAEATMRRMSRMGMQLEKVDVDVEDLLRWCQEQGYAVDGEARAAYTAEKVRQLHEWKAG